MLAKRKLTVDDVFTMSAAGVFAPDERVELIDGELYTMTPPSSQHAGHVKWLIKQLERAYGDRAIVSAQDPLVLDEYRLLEPDLALLRLEDSFYVNVHPTAEDVFLVVEVSLSSLTFDKEVKLLKYAEAGVSEFWIVDVEREVAEVHWEPAGNRYHDHRLVRRGEKVSPRAFPDVEISIFPPL